MAVRLLIFDLDGTLVDSSVDISNALNYAIGPYGLPPVTVQETVGLVGEGVTRLIGKVIERSHVALDPSALVERFLTFYSSHLADHTRPYPGAEKALGALGTYRKAVVSNKIERLSVQVLRATDLMRFFDYVAGGDTAAEKKPSPVPILDVLARFAVRQDEALIIGDSIYDIEAGRAAGIRTVAALYGFGDPSFPRDADYRIETIERLPGVVEQAEGYL
jgi:phosphoglycolate phosphatase